MATVFNRFCTEKDAFINPWDTTQKIPGFPKICITTFSEGMIRDYAKDHAAAPIACLYSANGALPVYEITYKNTRMGLFLSRIGAPACAAGLEEIIAYGAEKIIQFGCCGILDQSLVGNKIILPSSAVRDEGTSYHYLSGSEEINADSSSMDIAIQCLKHHKIPYITGKVWTTDAIYRETPAVIRERKAQGCIAVEMECSASLAVARFRNIPIIQFFYGADSLDGDTWDMRDLTDYGMCQKDTYMAIALECAIAWVS